MKYDDVDMNLVHWLIFDRKDISDYRIALETGLTKQGIGKYRLGETDLKRMTIKNAMALTKYANKLEEEKMKQVRIELSDFGGSKRKQLEAAVNQAIKELGLADESYYENDDNAIDRFQARLASESVNDTQAVVVTIGEPNIIQHDYADAIYSDEDAGEEGGFERVVRHFTIDDLKEANVHVLLTFDI